tara:strand:+ start:92 stop:676 length:585 start_codon:yes stop_codon:yes gene_type:complete
MVAGKLEYVNPEYFTEGEVDDFLIHRDDDEPEPELDIPTTDKYKYMVTTDPGCNYLIGSKGVDEDMELIKDNTKVMTTTNSPIDYAITQTPPEPVEINLGGCDPTWEANEIDKRDTLSYMSVKTIEEGEEWYRQNFPQVPDELYSIMARWNWGDLSEITKKDIKNDKKRVARGKKPKKEPVALERKTGNFIIEF